jgi:hypothetical protein
MKYRSMALLPALSFVSTLFFACLPGCSDQCDFHPVPKV